MIFDVEPKPYVSHLGKLLANPTLSIRAQATQAVMVLGPKVKDLLPTLIINLGDPEPGQVVLTMLAIAQLGEAAKAAIPVLEKMIDDTKLTPAVRDAAQKAKDFILKKKETKTETKTDPTTK